MAQTTQETKQSKQATLFKAKDYNIMIGVDPGSITGVCVWDPDRQKILDMQSMSHVEFMEWIIIGDGVYHMVVAIENPNLNQPVFMTKEETGIIFGRDRIQSDTALRILLRRAQNIGMNKQIAKTFMEFMESKGIAFVPIRPFRKKMDAEQFKNLTKWEGRTNQHNRDAAILVFGL